VLQTALPMEVESYLLCLLLALLVPSSPPI
jgi:hypothetical protein